MRFWFSAVALSASVMALCPTQLIHAAARMQDAYSTTATETGNAVPAMHLAQGHSPVGGGKGGGGLGGGAGMHGGGGGLGGGAGMHGGGGGLGGGAGMHGGGGGLGGGAGMHGVGGGLGGGAGMHGVGGGLGGGAGMHGVGGGLGGGPTMRTLAPGAGGRFVTPGMTPRRYISVRDSQRCLAVRDLPRARDLWDQARDCAACPCSTGSATCVRRALSALSAQAPRFSSLSSWVVVCVPLVDSERPIRWILRILV